MRDSIKTTHQANSWRGMALIQLGTMAAGIRSRPEDLHLLLVDDVAHCNQLATPIVRLQSGIQTEDENERSISGVYIIYKNINMKM